MAKVIKLTLTSTVYKALAIFAARKGVQPSTYASQILDNFVANSLDWTPPAETRAPEPDEIETSDDSQMGLLDSAEVVDFPNTPRFPQVTRIENSNTMADGGYVETASGAIQRTIELFNELNSEAEPITSQAEFDARIQIKYALQADF